MKILVKVLRDDTSFDLQIELVAGEQGLARDVTERRVQKPGLALAGFREAVRPGAIQVIGQTEGEYLRSLDDNACRGALQNLFATPLACLVLTDKAPPPAGMVETANREKVTVFSTALDTEPFVGRLHNLLDEHLSPEIAVHAGLVDVFGVGILLVGQSGIGKSECALDLVLRGHRIVADDVVMVRQQGRGLVGMGSPLTRHHMEVRGLGIINVKELFGAASVRKQKRVELVVEMVDWQPSAEYDRTGLDGITENLLEVDIPKIRLPIRPGRNIASIVEVAARNHLLKLQGHHSARQFKEALEQRLASGDSATAESE